MYLFTQERKQKKSLKSILSLLLSLTLVCGGFHGAVGAKSVSKTKGGVSTAKGKNNKNLNKNGKEEVAFGFVIIGGVKLAEAAVTLASLYLVLCKNDLDVVRCVNKYVEKFNKLNKITGEVALEFKRRVQQKVGELSRTRQKQSTLTPAQEAKQIFDALKKNEHLISTSTLCEEQIKELRNSGKNALANELQKLCSPFSKGSEGSTASCEFTEFKNEETARSFGTRFFQCWFQSLTPEEKKVILDYTDGEYNEINRCLREPASCNEEVTGIINKLKSALNKAKIPVDILVKRGGAVEILGELKDIATKNPQQLVGRSFSTPGFMSTGLVQPRSNKVELRIKIREGTKGCAYVGNNSANPREEEVLCVPGKKLRITKVEVRDKKLVLDAEMIN